MAAWLILIAILAVPMVICGVIYNDKSGGTPCIGCGECIRTGECVLVKNRKKNLKNKPKENK